MTVTKVMFMLGTIYIEFRVQKDLTRAMVHLLEIDNNTNDYGRMFASLEVDLHMAKLKVYLWL